MTTAHARRVAQAAADIRARATQLADAHQGGVGGRESNPDPAPRSPTPGAPRQSDHRTGTELRQCPRCFGPTTTPEEHCR